MTCANCNKEINLETDAQTWCSGCDKVFCCAMTSGCYYDYHMINNIRSGHSHRTILNPAWKINLKVLKE